MTYNGMTLYLEVNNKRYVIHPNGNIERTDRFHEPSDQWKMLGLCPKNSKTHTLTPLKEITPEWVENHHLGKFEVVAIDHGTQLHWGARIYKIGFFNKPEDTNYYQYSRDNLRNKVYYPSRLLDGGWHNQS